VLVYPLDHVRVEYGGIRWLAHVARGRRIGHLSWCVGIRNGDAAMNLAALRFAHGDRFYSQTWFDGEAFMLREPAPSEMPKGFVPAQSAASTRFLPYTATLAQLFVDNHDHPYWTEHPELWTGDFDAQGQQVFILIRDGKFEIHRELRRDKRGYATW
jgi:hypothetical protein